MHLPLLHRLDQLRARIEADELHLAVELRTLQRAEHADAVRLAHGEDAVRPGRRTAAAAAGETSSDESRVVPEYWFSDSTLMSGYFFNSARKPSSRRCVLSLPTL